MVALATGTRVSTAQTQLQADDRKQAMGPDLRVQRGMPSFLHLGSCQRTESKEGGASARGLLPRRKRRKMQQQPHAGLHPLQHQPLSQPGWHKEARLSTVPPRQQQMLPWPRWWFPRVPKDRPSEDSQPAGP